MKKLDIGNPPSKISHIKAKLKKRSFWEPALLILLLLFVLGSVIGFALFGSTEQVRAESSNAKMISELNDINSYLNELDEDVTNNQKSLASVTENNSNSLKEEVYNTKEEISLTIDESVTELNSKMDILHEKISATETSILDLLTILNTDSEENQQQINEQFSQISGSLEEIQDEFSKMIDEVKALLEKLSKSQEANHKELKEVLDVMATDMETTATENLDQMMESLTNMEESYTKLVKDYHTDTINSISELNENMESNFASTNEAITNQFSQLNESVDNHFKETNESITNQYTELTTIVNANDDDLTLYLESLLGDINNKLDSVFTSVSSGKRLLASALLTKGVECPEDATFETIYNAILSINQQLVIGVEKIPGEIEYEYHYHVNGLSEYPHTDKVLPEANGGCYTVPIYHAHTGNTTSGGGCYSVPYTTTRQESYQEDQGCHGYLTYWPEQDKSQCGSCGAGYYGNRGGEKCPHYHDYVTKYKTVTCTEYKLGCGMTTQTIISYRIGCGLSDGQLIGAHILYTGYDSVPKVNNMPASVSYSVINDTSVVEETEQESVEEFADESVEATTEEVVVESEPESETETETETEPESETESIMEETEEVTQEADDTVSGNEIIENE